MSKSASLFGLLIVAAFLDEIQGTSSCDELCEAKQRKSVKSYELILNNAAPIEVPHKYTNGLDIFCLKGLRHPDLKALWTSVTLRIFIANDKYSIYKGPNETCVFSDYKETLGNWLQHLMPWKSEYVSLSPFNQTCIGISTQHKYSVRLQKKVLDPWFLVFLIGGIILFMTAKKLSSNILFFYGTGISFGLLASLLILVFIISRFIPQKTGAYTILLAGWSIAIYLLHHILENVQTVLENYYVYVASYFCVAGLVSWAVCYYKGPPSNPRALNLIQWLIQAIGLVLIYSGTQIPEVSVTIIIIVVLNNLLSGRFSVSENMISRIKSFWRRKFPPKVKLLTADEYERQAQVETQKALDELRQYCRSPECNAWKTISRMHSPSRFANFVEGESHLSDEEVYDYDRGALPLPFREDDEDEIDFRLSTH
ncbi:hypothetical protein CAPTEDRAFT_178472 [Capitella teleta]|uniref:Nuclear envelope integral membrane protein 1 n=1 Tax=Capitella teleta TaxID=283909 RepID=R7UPC7_CAPTE|nr:hypothetical protein CAPTEDRAFT_178472 [Capitella teleta]|eukprot:ELU07958.1 hypothetical protein CAPTEDRAFT_178472 [Capitella teleta]